MAELSLEWIEAGRLNTKKIVPKMTLQQPELLRIGRDPARCDIVLADGSVSGLHVEVGYDPAVQQFYVHNLRESNPPIVNGQRLKTGRVALESENTIQLGNVQLRAIAHLPAQATPLPETDIHVLQAEVPPTEVLPVPAPVPSPPPSPISPLAGSLSPDSDSTQSQTSNSSAKSFGLIAGGLVLMLALFLLAWPNISGFLGIGRGRVISEPSGSNPSSSNPSGSNDDPAASGLNAEPFTTAEIVPYIHSSGIFSLVIPEDWEFLDNSQPGEVVIQGWHHPQVNSYAIVRIFDADSQLSRSQLEEFGANTVDTLFGELVDFQRGNPIRQSDQSVRVQWQAQDGPDTLVAFTFVRQDGPHLSVLSIWLPEDIADFEAWLEELELIVASYRSDPDVDLP